MSFLNKLLVELVVIEWCLQDIEEMVFVIKFQIDLSSVIELLVLDLEHNELRLLFLYHLYRFLDRFVIRFFGFLLPHNLLLIERDPLPQYPFRILIFRISIVYSFVLVFRIAQ